MLSKYVKRQVFRLAEAIEGCAAQIVGKGIGAGSIQLEVELVFGLLGRAPNLAIDMGANIGEYTAKLRYYCKTLEIHAFEPSLTNIRKLRERFLSDTSVFVIPYAIAQSDGSMTLYSNQPGSGLASLSQRRLDHFGIDFNSREIVRAVRFEGYWTNQLEMRNIDIVKMDIEGHEMSALQGFGKAIHAINIIQFEFGGCNIDSRTYFQDFWYYFSDAGFDIYRITPLGLQRIDRYRESDEFFLTTNYIAVNRLLLR